MSHPSGCRCPVCSESQYDESASSSPYFSAAGYACLAMPIETLKMLADTDMLDLHDDNGPGSVECPVCRASIAMQWQWGKRLDNPDEIQHEKFCPVAWAKRRN